MISEVKTFCHDFLCHKGGGSVVVSGNLIQSSPPDGSAQPHRVKITYCSGVAQCGSALPKVALAGECAVVDALLVTA
jgi:hypothetical protein